MILGSSLRSPVNLKDLYFTTILKETKTKVA